MMGEHLAHAIVVTVGISSPLAQGSVYKSKGDKLFYFTGTDAIMHVGQQLPQYKCNNHEVYV